MGSSYSITTLLSLWDLRLVTVKIKYFWFVTWPLSQSIRWLCGWGPLILSHCPAKLGIHLWCYLVIGCFDWKIVVFEQTVVRVIIISLKKIIISLWYSFVLLTWMLWIPALFCLSLELKMHLLSYFYRISFLSY